jgi:anti-sigma B factor antagonist
VSPLATLEVSRDHASFVLRVQGEVDISNREEIAGEIEAAISNAAATIVLDLTETTYLDSAGVQLLFQLAHRMQARRQELKLVVPKDSPIRAVLELTGLPRLVALEG